uniref:Thioredoxin domain-containing protein n=2 Tax=Chaetoceros debilis TaxID=122233 RepID=A0A7S3PZB1_9STRA|mmetsp:Transcript_12377/g.18065  ORF Transcript_12377/g.18065 Transcript_12377/m.18065 type:complete len:647 (-) Transcript_12377:134-2074(-)
MKVPSLSFSLILFSSKSSAFSVLRYPPTTPFLSLQRAQCLPLFSLFHSVESSCTESPDTNGVSLSSLSISREQLAILDGSNYNSFNAFISTEGVRKSDHKNETKLSPKSEDQIGYCNVFVGRLDGKRIVGISADHNFGSEGYEVIQTETSTTSKIPFSIYKDSIAELPASSKIISDDDAISTFVAAMTAVHCAYHNPIRKEDTLVEGVGGSNDTFEADGSTRSERKSIVVMGGSDYASFIADGIAALGAKVTQVSTNKLLSLSVNSRNKSVSILGPGVGDLEIPFCSALRKFDAIVDTLSDESSGNGPNNSSTVCVLGLEYSTKKEECNSAVISQLNKQNKCHRYVSTINTSQMKVRDNGLLFGRGKAEKYIQGVVGKMQAQGSRPLLEMLPAIYEPVRPPKSFGTGTLQTLFDAGVVYKSNKDALRRNKDILVQSWNLNDFFELVTWPRDSGGGNIRFGLPTVEDLDSMSTEMLDEDDDGIAFATPVGPARPKSRSDTAVPSLSSETSSNVSEDQKNPYVVKVESLADLNDEVIRPQKDCVLFLSAQYCRTCKYLAPQYTKLARSNSLNDGDLVFAKTNTVGKVGKEVSKALGVDAVPTFVLFRNGKRFGTTLSVSRMPSKKLNAALELLTMGDDWDGKKVMSLK